MTKQQALVLIIGAANEWAWKEPESLLEDALEIIAKEINEGRLKLEG